MVGWLGGFLYYLVPKFSLGTRRTISPYRYLSKGGENESESLFHFISFLFGCEKLIPKVSFDRYDGNRWMPVIAYQPGGFEVFDDQQRRLR